MQRIGEVRSGWAGQSHKMEAGAIARRQIDGYFGRREFIARFAGSEYVLLRRKPAQDKFTIGVALDALVALGGNGDTGNAHRVG